MKRLLMFMMVAAIMMATSALAADKKLYVSGNVGYNILTDMDGDPGETISFDSSFGFLLAMGYD